jgi:hypothetical protein
MPKQIEELMRLAEMYERMAAKGAQARRGRPVSLESNARLQAQRRNFMRESGRLVETAQQLSRASRRPGSLVRTSGPRG